MHHACAATSGRTRRPTSFEPSARKAKADMPTRRCQVHPTSWASFWIARHPAIPMSTCRSARPVRQLITVVATGCTSTSRAAAMPAADPIHRATHSPTSMAATACSRTLTARKDMRRKSSGDRDALGDAASRITCCDTSSLASRLVVVSGR